MASTQRVGTLGEIVADSEAALFVGRAPELAAFANTLAEARERPRAVYVHGPAGVGKSALLRAYRRTFQDKGIPGALLDAQSLGQTPEDLMRQMVRVLGPLTAADILSSATDLVVALNRRARAAGFALLVDAYDALAGYDDWLRQEVFRHLGRGVCLVLAGRMPPAQLWAQDLGWRRALREIRLGDLNPREVAEFLGRCGLHNPAVWSAVVALSGGNPLLLQRAANTLLRHGPGAPAEWGSGPWMEQNEDALASFLIELMLHPSSRRRAWRAGTGSAPLDSLIAAASLLPDFDRDVLTATAGRATVEGAWATMLELPVITAVGPIYRFHGPFRRRLENAVLRQRPWAERRWRRLAIAHELRRSQEAPEADEAGLHWARIAHLAREARWYGWMHPAAEELEDWRFEQGMRPEDREALARCGPLPGAPASSRQPGPESGPADGGRPEVEAAGADRIAEVYPQGFLLARRPGGQIVGYLAAVPLQPDTRGLLCSLPSPAGAHLRRLPPEAVTAAEGRTLVWCHGGVLDPDSGVEGALVREACRAAGRYPRIVATAAVLGIRDPARPTDRATDPALIEALGFRPCVPPASPTAAAAEGAPDPLWTLQLDAGYPGWLQLSAAVDTSVPVPPEQRPAAAKEALLALDDPERLARTVASRYYAELSGDRTQGAVRAWLLDALASADLGEGPSAGRILLSLYYVERTGSHEAVAERMDLPRATYFRSHRQALTRFGEALFG